MREVRGSLFVSLDGVIQAPGGPTEDPTGGFEHGGWVAGVFDDEVGAAVGEVLAGPYDLLLGRRTYDIFAAYWPFAGEEHGDIATAFNAAGKYVLSRRGLDLDWAGSRRLSGVEEVAALKASEGPDLVIQGSGTLYPALIAAGLIDRVTLLTFPVVLGRGKRWFGDDLPAASLRMVDHRVTRSGTVIATYEPAGPVATQAIAPPSTSVAEAERQRRMREGSW